MIRYLTNLFKAFSGRGLKDKSVPETINGTPEPIPENKNEDIWAVNRVLSQEHPGTPHPFDLNTVTPLKDISHSNGSIDSTNLPIVDVPKEKERKQILFAEDDLLLRKTLSFYLTESGFNIIQAENGVEAVEQIKKMKFDLMIIDLNMPFIGGMEIINMVHNELKLATPIIVLTSSGVEEVELESFTMGANEFISKPFSPSVLKARMDKLIAKFAT